MCVIRWLVALSTRRSQFAVSLTGSGATALAYTYLWLTFGPRWWSALAMLLGVLFYTFMEYVYHRWVAHQWLDYRMPDVHHAVPDNYFAAPWMLVPPTAFVLYMLVVLLTGRGFALPFMVGVAWCHLWQEGVHFAAHHTEFPWGLRLHHSIHHLYETHNFGHSTTLWDRVFHTQIPSTRRWYPDEEDRARSETLLLLLAALWIWRVN